MKTKKSLGSVGLFFVLAVSSAGCAGAGDDAGDTAELVVTPDDQMEDVVFDQMSAEGKEDGALSYEAVARLVHNAGVSCDGDRTALAIAVARAESSFRPGITNTAGNAHGTDRGLWQINGYWHPEVSVACALSPSCAARAMKRITSNSTKWSEWWTYNNHKQLPFMHSARAAQAIVCAY